MTQIEWLAGRGYTMIHVGWPATFTGRQHQVTGKFLAVVWENLADPIITGRDEIGHPKLYAEIEQPRIWDGAQLCGAGWMGFRFLDPAVTNFGDAPLEPRPATPGGTLMLKYIPSTGAWGEQDVCQITFTPPDDRDRSIEQYQLGKGSVRFHRATFAELPTMHHVVNALTALPVIETREGAITRSRGGKSLRDQQVLR